MIHLGVLIRYPEPARHKVCTERTLSELFALRKGKGCPFSYRGNCLPAAYYCLSCPGVCVTACYPGKMARPEGVALVPLG